MATAKKTPAKKTAAKKTAAKKTASKKTAPKKAAVKAPAKQAAKTVAAKKTAAKKTAAKKTASKKGAAKAKTESLVKQKRSTGDGPACWPGFERVPGKEAGTKGSCKPKPNQSKGEKKEDAREAAGSKLRKAGGNKGKANRS